MNKINIILFTLILLLFLFYKNIIQPSINEPFSAQVPTLNIQTTLNIQAGLVNDGNHGASGGGGAGGIVGGSTTIQSNGGLPLTNTTGFAGGDGINNNTTAGGGGGARGPGRDNNDDIISNQGLGGDGISLLFENNIYNIPTRSSTPSISTTPSRSSIPSISTTPSIYCAGGAGGKRYYNGSGYKGPITPIINGCGGDGASNKDGSIIYTGDNTNINTSYTGGNGAPGIVYIKFDYTGVTKSTPADINTLLENIIINSSLSNNQILSGLDTGFHSINDTTTRIVYLKFFIPSKYSINNINYIMNFNPTIYSNGNTSITTTLYIIGGGGGGGGCFDNSRTGGGGGAGQYITKSSIILSTNAIHYITIGNGGKGGIGNKNGNDGFETSCSFNTNITTSGGQPIINYIANGGGGGAGGGVTNNSKNEELIKKLIRKIYVVDVDSIRNLSIYASKLVQERIQIDGTLKVADKIILSSDETVGTPQYLLNVTNSDTSTTKMGKKFGNNGTKIVLKSGADGAANSAIHPYALGINTGEMWNGLPFTTGNTILCTQSSTTPYTFTNTVATTTAALTIPKSYTYTTTPNKFNWYSGNNAVLTLDSNSNLILGQDVIKYSTPTVTNKNEKPSTNTLYTVRLNIGTYENGSLLTFINNALNINTNLICGGIIISGEIISSGTLSIGSNTIKCGTIIFGTITCEQISIDSYTITCGTLKCNSLVLNWGITVRSSLTCGGDIELVHSNCIHFGSNLSKGEMYTAGKIYYDAYGNETLCIFGTAKKNNFDGDRNITMSDNVHIESNLSCKKITSSISNFNSLSYTTIGSNSGWFIPINSYLLNKVYSYLFVTIKLDNIYWVGRIVLRNKNTDIKLFKYFTDSVNNPFIFNDSNEMINNIKIYYLFITMPQILIHSYLNKQLIYNIYG
jgi:hypothetical protein